MNAEAYKTHLVFERLEQLKQSLQTENLSEKIGIENFAFLESVYHYINDKLNLTNPILVQEAELTNLAAQIEAGTSQISTFIGNNNIGHITNAINNFNSAITRTRNLPIPESNNEFDFSKSAAHFQQTVQSGYEQLKTENEKLKNDLLAIQTDLSTKQETIKTLEQQLAEKQAEIQNALIKYNNDFEILKTNANATVETERKKFSDSFEADRKAFKESIDTEKETFKKAYENQKEFFDAEAKSIVEKLEQKLAEANKIVNIVGNVGVTGNYQNIANENKKAANLFRIIALIFMVIMSGLLIWSIIEISKNGEFNMYKSLVRILAAAVLTYPAVYAARESTRHRKLETQNRNLELELASIGPFIELLPETKKQLIKEELVKKYFGNHKLMTEDKQDEEDVSINALERIFKAVLPFIKKS